MTTCAIRSCGATGASARTPGTTPIANGRTAPRAVGERSHEDQPEVAADVLAVRGVGDDEHDRAEDALHRRARA